MKLTTWNCARGFAKKKDLIFSSSPDIAVIQECSKKSTESLSFDGYDATWFGSNPSMGMGVFYKKETWNLRRLEASTHDIQWVVPYAVTGPESFTLFAIWACRVKSGRRDSYVGQINRALSEHPEWFDKGQVVLAGDFNSNAQWDKERPDWNHSTMVASLRRFGISSAYHLSSGEEHGEETTPTFHLRKNRNKDFHIDYVFVPDSWQHRLQTELGDCSVWLPHSDHCPLTISLSPFSAQ